MANKTLKTRIKLKYDTLQNWETNNPVLLAGEIAIVAIPTGSETTVGQVTKPAIVFKVGDGTSTFSALPYASGLAADVYAWAKAASKPTYTAAEVGAATAADITAAIQGLDSQAAVTSGQFITGFDIVDGKVTNVQYGTPDEVSIPEYTLQSDSEGTVSLYKDSVLVGAAVPIDGFSDIAGLARSAIQNIAEGSTNGTISVDGEDVAIHGLGSAAYTASSAYATAAQGAKADTAVQNVVEGTANGTISVDGSDVSVHGLGSAAYTESSAYDAAGAASSAVGTHNTAPDAHADIRSQVTALAEKVSGRATAYVYQNKSDEDYTTAIGKAGSFVVGDTIYFLDADIPDEWVTAVNAESPFYTFQEIETESPSFDGYVTGTGLTADKIVLGNAGSAVKASVYGIVTTLTAADNANVATSKAVADYIAGLGYQTSDNVNSLIQAATIQGSKVSGAVALATEAAGYTSDGAIAAKFTEVEGIANGKADPSDITDAIAALNKADSAVSNQYVTAVSEADGIITVTRKQIAYSEISGTPVIPEAANAGKLLGADGVEIFNANQSEDSTIIVIDCGSSSELVD